MKSVPAYACVLLAAGGSSRLGRPKQLLQLAGETLLSRAARIALGARLRPVIVVLGAHADEMRSALGDLPVQTVVNGAWKSGMASSLRTGIAELLSTAPETTHLLVLVCDQVALTQDVLRQLLTISAANPDRIIAAEYSGRRGVPAVFPVGLVPLLMKLDGDRGARALMDELHPNVIGVPFAEGALDIDRPEDVDRAGLR